MLLGITSATLSVAKINASTNDIPVLRISCSWLLRLLQGTPFSFASFALIRYSIVPLYSVSVIEL